MKIGELAKKTGCQVVTVRYYEKEGLLGEPERSQGNYRLYSHRDVERLEFIMHCRKHGMKLDEIRGLLSFRDNPEQDCTWVTDLINTHIVNVNEQIRSLMRLRRHLENLREKCSGGHDAASCAIMQSLEDRELCCEGEETTA